MTKCNMKSVSQSKDSQSPITGSDALAPDRSRTRSRNACRGRRNDVDDRPGVYSRVQMDTPAENQAFASNNQEKGNNLFVFGNSSNTVQNNDKNKFSFTAPRKPPKPQPFQFVQPFQATPQSPVVNNLPTFENKPMYTGLDGSMATASHMQNSTVQQQCGNTPVMKAPSQLPSVSSTATQMNMLTQSNVINGFNPFIVPQQSTSTQFGCQQQPANFNSAGIQYNITSNQQLSNPSASGIQFSAQSQQSIPNFNNSAFQFNGSSQQQGPSLNNSLSSLQFGQQSQQQGPNLSNSGLQFGLNQQSPNFNNSGMQYGMQPQQQGPNFSNSGIQLASQQQQQASSFNSYGNLNNSSMQFGTQPQQQVSNLNNSCMQYGAQPQKQQTQQLNNTGMEFDFQSSNLNNTNTQFGMPQQQFNIQSQQPGTNFNATSLQFGGQQQQQMFQPGFQPAARPQNSKNVLKSRATRSPAFNFNDMWKLPQQQPAFTPPPTHPAMQPSTSGFNQSPQSNVQLPLILPPTVPTPQPTFRNRQSAPATPQPAFGAQQPAFGTPQTPYATSQPTTPQSMFGMPQQTCGVPQAAPLTHQPQSAFGMPQGPAPEFNPRPNVPKTKSQRLLAVKPTCGTGSPQPAQQAPVPGFNPLQIPPHATSQNSLSLAQIQNLDLDTIINFRKSQEADFRESMILFSKINPFASIPMVESRGKVEKPQLHHNPTATTSNNTGMKEIYLELPRSVVAATPLAKRIEMFKVSEREITFGKTIDDGSHKKHAEQFRRRKPVKLSEGDEKTDTLPKPTKSRKREHKSKPMPLRKPRREDRCTSCHILLPKSTVFVQCNACYVSQGTQCDAVKQQPCGITLKREGYYTIPPLEELPKLRRIDGQCVVKGFTIGRKGYGSVSYQEPVNITNLNLDEIVHFDYREISLYPDESKKPPIGQGLNRRAQVTLDSIYPTGKGPYDVIRNTETIKTMNFEGTLRNMCKQNGSRFVDYRPETGSWIFVVEHFSKYKFKEPLTKEEIKIIKKKEEAKKKERIEIIERQIKLNEIHLGRIHLRKADELIQGLKNNVLGHCKKFSNALTEIEDKIADF